MSATLIGPLAGCRLCTRDTLCQVHADAWIRTHRGNVVELGIMWATKMAKDQPSERSEWKPWPGYDDSAKVQAAAWGKVASSGLGDRRITLELARACADAARAWYERRRLDPSAPLFGPVEPLPIPSRPSHLPAEVRRRRRRR